MKILKRTASKAKEKGNTNYQAEARDECSRKPRCTQIKVSTHSSQKKKKKTYVLHNVT